jgi:hypothetical protein
MLPEAWKAKKERMEGSVGMVLDLSLHLTCQTVSRQLLKRWNQSHLVARYGTDVLCRLTFYAISYLVIRLVFHPIRMPVCPLEAIDQPRSE